MYLIFFFSVLSYLLGSFSTAFWFCKWFHNIDIQQVGSKSAGATNAWRECGFKIGISVFILDAMKTFIAVQLIHFIPNITTNSECYFQIKILFGMCSVIGHIVPLYSGFKGGKSVASMFGLFFGINPLIGIILLGIFTITILLSKIVSLSSLCTAITYPFLTLIFNSQKSVTLTIFSFFAFLLIIVTHRKNIERLIRGGEKKIIVKKQQNINE